MKAIPVHSWRSCTYGPDLQIMSYSGLWADSKGSDLMILVTWAWITNCMPRRKWGVITCPCKKQLWKPGHEWVIQQFIQNLGSTDVLPRTCAVFEGWAGFWWFCDVSLNKMLTQQLCRRWFVASWRSCDFIVMAWSILLLGSDILLQTRGSRRLPSWHKELAFWWHWAIPSHRQWKCHQHTGKRIVPSML